MNLIFLNISAREERLQKKIVELEQVIQDLVQQDKMLDKWSILQSYVLVTAELERVSLAAFDLQNDNITLAKTLSNLKQTISQQQTEIEQYKETQDQVREEHEQNVSKIECLIEQNEILNNLMAKLKANSSQGFKQQSSESDNKINLLLAVNQKLENDYKDYHLIKQQLRDVNQKLIESENINQSQRIQLNKQKQEINQALNEMKLCEDLFRDALDKQKQQITNQQQEIEDLKEENQLQSSKINELLIINEQAQQQIHKNTDLLQQDTLIKEKLVETQNKFRILLDNQERYESILEKLKEELNLQHKANNDLKEEIIKQSNSFELKHKEVEQKNEEIRFLEKKYKSDLSEFKSSTHNELAQLQSVIDQKNISQKEQEFQQRLIEQQKQKVSTLEQQILRDTQHQDQELKKWKTNLEQYKQKYENLEGEALRFRSEKEEQVKKIRMQKDEENDKLAQQIQSLRQDNSKMKQIIIDLTDSLNQQKTLFHQTQSESLKVKEKIDQLLDQKAKLERNLGDAKLVLIKNEEEVDFLRKGSLAKADEYNKICSWNKQLHEQVNELVIRNSQLNSILRENHTPQRVKEFYTPLVREERPSYEPRHNDRKDYNYREPTRDDRNVRTSPKYRIGTNW